MAQPTGQWGPPQAWGPPRPPRPPKKRISSGAVISITLGSVFAVFVGCSALVGLAGSSTRNTTPSYGVPNVPTRPGSPVTAAPVAPPAAPAGTVGNGTWIVGTDLQPGTYRSAGAKPGFIELCTWITRAGVGGNSDIIDIGNTADRGGQQVVQIGGKVKSFESSGCESWVKIG